MTTPLPMTVIGGYLGAGKTTLINRLLAEPHGQRVMVMVNDFGAINIDAALLAEASEDTLTLTNGCVCCTMGADLFQAVADVLDRPDRPDHLVIEASGIADPARIAHLALAEPDLSYGGILTVVHALDWPALAADPQIGAQLQGQLAAADLIALSHTEAGPAPVLQSPAPVVLLSEVETVAPLILTPQAKGPQAPVRSGHAHYKGWSTDSAPTLPRAALKAHLAARPQGLYRVKGFLPAPDGGWEVQVVGQRIQIRATQTARPTGLVAIGLADRVNTADIDAWWARAS